MRLDRDAAFFLQIHIVQRLRLQFSLRNGVGIF